ncbi:SWI/SNF-related matrix-associated actin-dependent regulator of chromatin subfamily A containing DEAD/H box 1 homolog [Periplaneta americana]|uniref:SWI/SNF-related matrix-associated actin-dependent regulator of chromatin subfamily A containing DEAD/H box 1 homolog n=1 Tax=Periplaneta americana TaxID=6978 RepID=UPI0037E739C7
MSQESSSGSGVQDAPSPSLLNNLRQFRFQKKSTLKIETNRSNGMVNNGTPNDHVSAGSESLSSPESIVVQRKKPVARIQESDESDESEADSAVKENNLKFLEDAFPSLDKMVLQDALVSSSWSVEAAMALLCESGSSGDSKKRPADVRPRKKAKRRRIEDIEEDRDDDNDDNHNPYADDKVFDSDDSDQDISDELTGDKKEVLEFLSTATVGELRVMPHCSQKKAEAIIEQRPFSGWKDLVEKFQEGKFLGTELLNSAQDVLRARQVVQALMKKCSKLAAQMERAVAAGASSVMKQPSLLSPSLTLAGYQMVGLNWLLVMHSQGLNGILADEMGLGKTVQVIAFLAHLKETGMNGEGPHLVVVPSSTLENWSNEFARWCPSLNVETYYGSPEDRKAMRINWTKGGLENVDIILTTYSIVSSSPEERKMFRVLRMQYVVLDEAHMLKNMATQRYDNLARINAEHRILLTGTPLQNNLIELMSLLIFVMPHMFEGKKDILKSLFSKCPRDGTKNTKEDELPRFEQEQVAQARRIMKPFVLRRLKREVLKDLPTKTDATLLCPLTPSQREKYDDLIQTFSQQSAQELTGSNGELSGMAMMMQLRKMANHPVLLRYHFTDDQLEDIAKRLAADPTYKETNSEYIVQDLAIMSDYQIHSMGSTHKCLSGYRLPTEILVESGKFCKLDEILPKLKSEGHRVLIFSQFVVMLDVLQEYMRIRGHRYLRLDGSTPVTSRQELIDTYNADESIFAFLLSTRAGGLGINLTAADTVIIHDVDFNPYNDKQAEDRCHRVGQTRSVSVMRLLSEGTIEEGIHQVAQEKLNLEREISNPEENEPAEAKNVVRLLKQALGLDKAVSSPQKTS